MFTNVLAHTRIVQIPRIMPVPGSVIPLLQRQDTMEMLYHECVAKLKRQGSMCALLRALFRL